MNVAVCIGTHGETGWQDLAAERAATSAVAQNPAELILVHRDKGTLAEARNEAAASARSEWLCFLDADDVLEPGYLEAMALERSRAATSEPLLVPAVRYVERAGTPHVRVPEAAIPAWGRPIHEVNCAVVGTLVRRDLFHLVGGFPEEPIYEDWALWLACIREGAELVPVPDAVYRAHVRPGSRNTPTAVASEVYRRRRAEHEEWLRVRELEESPGYAERLRGFGSNVTPRRFGTD